MAIGSKFAYATDRPIEDAIGPAIKYNEQMGFKYREEAEKKKAEIAKAKAEQDKALPTFDDKVTYTPYESDNAMRFDLANKLRKRIDEASNDVRKGKISQQDWNLINANAKATLDFANQGAANINTQATKIATLASEGKLAKGSVDEALRLGGAYDNRRINFEINPDGTANTIIFDENNQIIEKGGIDKVGSSIYNPVYNVDFDTELQQFKNANPIDFIETIGNNQKVGVKELTPRLKNTIDKYAEAKLADKDALINAYYNQTKKFKKDITDPKDIALAKKYIVDKFEGSYNKELNVDEAYQGANYRRQLAQDKKDEIQAKPFVSDTPLRNDIKGDNLDPKSYYKGSIGFDEGKLKFNNLGGKSSGINNGYVTSFHLEKDGHVIATAKYLIDKGQKFKLPNGKEVKFQTASDLYNDPDTDQETKETLKPQLDSYTTSASYGDTYKIYSGDSPELNSLARKAGYNSKDALVSDLRKLNRDEIIANKAKPVQKETPRERALRLARK